MIAYHKKSSAPLSGLRILVGRARHQASALSAGLRELGAQVIEIPFIEIRRPRSFAPLDLALNRLPEYDWLILTSVNGVEKLWKRICTLRISHDHLAHLKIAAIGPATRRATEDRGLKVDVVPKEYVAESVVKSLRSKVKGKRVLLARAKVARDVIPRELRKLGAQVDVVEAYETVIPQTSRARLQTLLKSKRRPQIITFTSSSTARNFLELLYPTWRARPHPRSLTPVLQGIHFASIGPVTSGTLRELGLEPDIEARQYTIPGLIAAIAAYTPPQP
jgi:uroporphyrinogen-III synthase